jgi:hypothetical protein
MDGDIYVNTKNQAKTGYTYIPGSDEDFGQLGNAIIAEWNKLAEFLHLSQYTHEDIAKLFSTSSPITLVLLSFTGGFVFAYLLGIFGNSHKCKTVDRWEKIKTNY